MTSSVAFPYRLVSVCSRRRPLDDMRQKLTGRRRSQIDLEQDDSSGFWNIETEVFQMNRTNSLVIAFVFMLAMDLHAARRT